MSNAGASGTLSRKRPLLDLGGVGGAIRARPRTCCLVIASAAACAWAATASGLCVGQAISKLATLSCCATVSPATASNTLAARPAARIVRIICQLLQQPLAPWSYIIQQNHPHGSGAVDSNAPPRNLAVS